MNSSLKRGFELSKQKFSEKIKYNNNISSNVYSKIMDTYKIIFPKSYIEYLCEFGFFRLNDMMPTGIVDEDKLLTTGLGWIITRNSQLGVPKNIIQLDEIGDGSYYALDLSQMNDDEECPVVVWPVGGYDETPELEIVAPDFGTWFLEQVEEQIRRHKNT